MAQCTEYGLVMNIYESSDCSGDYEQEIDPVDMCFPDDSGTYIYNECPGSSTSAERRPATKSSIHKLQLRQATSKKLASKKH